MASSVASYGSFPGGGYSQPPPIIAPSRLPSEHSLLRSGGSDELAKKNNVNMWEIIFVPWVLLVLVLVCFLQAGVCGYFVALFFVPVVLIGTNLFFIRFHYNRSNNSEVVLGFLCLIAVVISLAVGTYAVLRSLTELHRLNQGASYSNVLPSDAGATKIDATTLTFTNETLVDLSRTFGFTDARSSVKQTYCVAPVSDGILHNGRVQFWAAGLDCCEMRTNFQCFEPEALNGHGATVIAVSDDAKEGFRMAVRGAEGAYGLTSGDHYLLVQWRQEPDAYKENLWKRTMTLFVVFGGSYLVMSMMIGCAIMPALAPKI